MSGDALVRHPREALDLTTLAVALRRVGAGRPALLAAVDQARTSLNHERDLEVRRALSWVCRAVMDPHAGGNDDTPVVDAALRAAGKALAPATDATGGPVNPGPAPLPPRGGSPPPSVG
jgi:hypothetical protein